MSGNRCEQPSTLSFVFCRSNSKCLLRSWGVDIFSTCFQWQNKDVSYYPVFPLTSILLTTLENAWGLPFWHLCGLAWQETLVKLLKHEKIIHCPQIGYNSHFLRACWSSGNKSLELENTEGRRDTLCVCVCPGSGCVPVPKCVCAACVSWVLACRFCNVFHASPGFACGAWTLPLTDLSSLHGRGLDKHWARSMTSTCSQGSTTASMCCLNLHRLGLVIDLIQIFEGVFGIYKNSHEDFSCFPHCFAYTTSLNFQ